MAVYVLVMHTIREHHNSDIYLQCKCKSSCTFCANVWSTRWQCTTCLVPIGLTYPAPKLQQKLLPNCLLWIVERSNLVASYSQHNNFMLVWTCNYFLNVFISKVSGKAGQARAASHQWSLRTCAEFDPLAEPSCSCYASNCIMYTFFHLNSHWNTLGWCNISK